MAVWLLHPCIGSPGEDRSARIESSEFVRFISCVDSDRCLLGRAQLLPPASHSFRASHAAKKAKKTPAAVQVSLIYPANGVLAPNQPQMVQLGVTVQPKSGTQLNKYRLS